jgi:hypothetical protein
MSEKNKTPEILTPVGRASFVYVFEPRKTDNGERFSVVLMIPPSDDAAHNAQLAALKAEAKRAAIEFFGSEDKVRELQQAGKFLSPFKKAEDYIGKYEGFEPGCTIIEPWSKFRPQVVDERVQDIIDPREFYSGVWVRCMVRAFGYNNKKIGVGFGLGNIQRVRKDKALSGRKPASEQFVAIAGAPAAEGAAAPPAAGGDDFLG